MPPSHFDPNEDDSYTTEGTYRPVPSNFNSARQEKADEPRNQLLAGLGTSHSGTDGNCLQAPSHFFSEKYRSEVPLQPTRMAYNSPRDVQRREVFLPPKDGVLCEDKKLKEIAFEKMRLEAENEALKSLISKAQSPADLENARNNQGKTTLEAVIDHQTKHIAKLQRDLEEMSGCNTMKDKEMSQCRLKLANLEIENSKTIATIKDLENQCKEKEHESKNSEAMIIKLKGRIKNMTAEAEDAKKKQEIDLETIKKNMMEEKNMEIDKCRSDFEKECKKWQDELESKKTKQEKEIVAVTEKHKSEMDRLLFSMKEQEERNKAVLDSLHHKVESSEKQIELLSKEVTNERDKSEETNKNMTELKEELGLSGENSEKYCNEIKQLRTYIGEQQAEDYERSQWHIHRKNLENQVLSLQSEKSELNITLELQQVRLQSIMKILSTQEEAINANAAALSEGNVRANPAHVIVRKWREKVFELMVQCKSNEISLKQCENKWNLNKNEMILELEEEKRVTTILESQLSECRAQLEIQRRENVLLIDAKKVLSDTAEAAARKASQLENALLDVSENVPKFAEEFTKTYQDKLLLISEKVIRLEQKIAFANNRFRTIRDLFLRRDNLWRGKLKQIRDSKVCTDKEEMKESIPEESLAKRNSYLMSEIERLTLERDMMAQRLLQDSSSFETTAENFRQRENELERNIVMTQHELQEKSEEVADLRAQIQDLLQKVKDQEYAMNDAKECAAQLKINQEKEVANKVEEAQTKLEAEKRELEKKLNSTQREHAKTVVALRQSQRISVREKGRANEDLNAFVSQHSDKLEKLHRKIKVLQQDNNLLMSTIRQHGLLSTVKAAKAEPVAMQPDEPVSDNLVNHSKSPDSVDSLPGNMQKANAKVNQAISGSHSEGTSEDIFSPVLPHSSSSKVHECENSGEDVEKMLKDLAVLTEEILQNSDEN